MADKDLSEDEIALRTQNLSELFANVEDSSDKRERISILASTKDEFINDFTIDSIKTDKEIESLYQYANNLIVYFQQLLEKSDFHDLHSMLQQENEFANYYVSMQCSYFTLFALEMNETQEEGTETFSAALFDAFLKQYEISLTPDAIQYVYLNLFNISKINLEDVSASDMTEKALEIYKFGKKVFSNAISGNYED